MITKKVYKSGIHYTSDIVTEYEIVDHLPEKLQIEVNEELAREIVGVASLLKELKSGVYTRQATGLVTCLRYDPDLSDLKAAADPDGNIMPSAAQHLLISRESFKVTAFVNEWSFTVDSEWFLIEDLLKQFDLHPDLLSNPIRELVQSIAGMSIWDYDKNDGTPYKECEEPSEGYVDSHCALMSTIEDARKVLAVM